MKTKGNFNFTRSYIAAVLLTAVTIWSGAEAIAASDKQTGTLPAPEQRVPHLLNLLKSRSAKPVTVNIVGFGSSVGVGACLPDPPTQAPVMYFGERLKAIFGSTKGFNVVAENRSKNGSILSQFLSDVPTGNWAAYLDEGKKQTLVVFAYGMNDGRAPMYNGSQPPPFFRSQMVKAIRLVQDAGADAVILTSPHCISTIKEEMPPSYNQTYPTFINAPVGPEQMTPPASQSVIWTDPLGNGSCIPVSQRHLQINEEMRQAARETDCALIDAERFWFEAVAKYGETALFNANERVHPNLLGHQLSYQKAIDAFLASLVASLDTISPTTIKSSAPDQ